MWVPVPPSAEAVAGRCDRAGQPVRQPDHRRPGRGPPAAGPQRERPVQRGVRLRGGRARASRRPTCRWDGQTMVYECGDLLAEGDAVPRRPGRTVADVDLDRLRQERLRQGTLDDNRRTHDDRVARVPHRRVRARRPTGDIGLRRKVDRFPFVPDDPERLALDCYEAYNIQVSGLEQRLTAIGQPKAIIGVSGGLDSTHALIVAAKAMDRLGRPRSDIHAFTMPGFATGDTTKSYATRLAKSLGVHLRGARHHRPRRGRCSTTSTTRSPTASRSTTSPSRTSRPGCATTTCSGWPTTAAASWSAPATCPSWRSAGAPTASATRCRTTTSTPACRRRWSST